MDIFLEIVGLALAILEIFFPRKGEVLESWIDSLPDKAPKLFSYRILFPIKRFTQNTIDKVFDNPKSEKISRDDTSILSSIIFHLSNLIALIFIGAIVYGFYYLMVDVWEIEFPFEDGRFPPMVYFVGAVLALILILSLFGLLISLTVGFFALILKIVISSLNLLTKGRAIGAIGLIIAIIGLSSRFIG